MTSRTELLALHQQHLAEAENQKKQMQTRQYHVAMAGMYYQLWRDAPIDQGYGRIEK